MDNTRNRVLQASTNQTKESLQQVTFDIGSTNSRIEKFETQFQQQFDAMDAKFMNLFNTLQSIVNQLLNWTSGPSSSDQTNVVDSSNSLNFQSNSFHRDPRLLWVEVNKFDGSNPMGWVTQMEHYFSLHGIIDDLAKLHYDFLNLDPE